MVHVVDTGAATSGRALSDRVDAVWTARIVELIRGLVPRLDREPRDPAGRYVATLLRCPSAALLSDTATSGMNRC
jgi:hypothetical protein